ncbi:lytic polysaccharide monooxygenase [Hypoxylon trugodes]|uniref:lytic polysaccharide monooxygenase n=1 Tax=Hypoxylon trugodes TaxID=326681 RepID=UPI00218E8F50|nr:lytic polysaccharide monooxygenase [Hypoxylon trugodes]KAI1391703.1 lytic polysaccharide monooxygenase [Hypoxylon trugodes]
MKSTLIAALAAFSAKVSAHATFQDLWVNGVDMGATCARLPSSNSPVTDVSSKDIACNAGTKPVSGKCSVAAGSTVTVEIHQQPGDRACNTEAIGGAHYGPVQVYMSSVSDASTADGSSSSWFKIFADTWAKNPSGGSGDDDYWGTKDINTCCGRMDVKIPTDLAPGDYLLRAEALALHTAGQSGGAQFYMTCFQLTITGSGSAKPAGVSLPGAYKASDPGILVNIHAALSTYVAPGPSVYASGSTKSAGSPCIGCASTCTAGSGPSSTAGAGATLPTKVATTTAAQPSSTSGAGAGCSVEMYGQCGGSGFTGCGTCGSGTCKKLNEYYSQCS